MKLLRETIRRIILMEGMKTIDDLPAGVIIIMEKINASEVWFYYADSNTHEEIMNGPVRGKVEIYEPNQEVTGRCSNAWMVGGSFAKKGWGPLLYDCAIEWATQNAGGLMADRGSVSTRARRVWKHYLDVRSNEDVRAHQLDDLRNTLTSDEIDNCDHASAGGSYYKYVRGEAVPTEPDDPNWNKSALSKRYTKSPTIMNQLGDKLVRI